MQTIEFAIKMEADGAQYYREQAKAFADHPIARAFEMLAEAEIKHQRLLERYQQRQTVDQMQDLSKENNVFNQLTAFKNDIASIPRQLDVYRKALELEKQSIQLYTSLLDVTSDQSGQKMIRYLIDEEKKHYSLCDELVTLIQRPEEWVEDAEFGQREDY